MDSLWTPAAVSALSGILILQLTNAIISLRSSRKVADISKAVDGSESRLLAEVRDLSARVAGLTNKPGDAARAAAAQSNVDAKAAITAVSTEPAK